MHTDNLVLSLCDMIETMLDIDLDSAPGVALLAALAERHGDALARAARLPTRLFLLRSPDAPGLRFVGGEADPARVFDLAAYRGGTFSLAGSGERFEDAFAACLGEGVERLSQVERPGDVALQGPYREAEPHVVPAARSMIQTLADGARGQGAPVSWVRARAGEREVLIPADWCLRRAAKGPLAIPGAALSTGCAAAATFEAAACRALLELVERDAVALWWIGGQRPRAFAAESAAVAEAVRLLGVLRQGRMQRASWLLDLTTDLGIPCVAAVSVDGRGRGLACGFAARLTPEAAARAAVLEMGQMELALVLASAKRGQGGEGALSEADRRHLDRATRIDADECALIHPLGAPSRSVGPACGGPAEELAAILAAFARRGVEAGLVDLTRPEFGIPVAWAVAPQLQLLPCSPHTERLQRMTRTTCGGDRWTGGVALL
jgi:ribosomal protein S12 methylthiotransferase accessory factor